MEWVRPLVQILGRDDTTMLDELQLVFELDPPLQDSYDQSRAGDLFERMSADDDFYLDVVDHLIGSERGWQARRELHRILLHGGSAWEFSSAPGVAWGQLRRRVPGPTKDALGTVQVDAPRAYEHLSRSWSRLMGRNPDPSSAYREAVRAVEVAAKSIVAPNDSLFTLGRAIGQLRASPERWSFVLEGASPTQVADMADLVWTGQLDRHGTDDASVPLAVSQEQADAAFYICLTLCRIFSGNLVRSVP